MYGSRDIPRKILKPTVTFDESQFPFIKDLQYGDKGELSISGIITRERMDDEENNVLKTIRILKSSPKKQARAE